MFNLQEQLDKRLADLKKKNRGETVDKAESVSKTQIRAALCKSGILSRSGKVRKLKIA